MRRVVCAPVATACVALSACGAEKGAPVLSAKAAADAVRTRFARSTDIHCVPASHGWDCSTRMGRRSYDCSVGARAYPPNSTGPRKPFTVFCQAHASARPAPPAPATRRAIVLNVGIGQVTLGMRRAAVLERLGSPGRRRSATLGEQGESASVWIYRPEHLEVVFTDRGVTRVETDDRRYRTDTDLGVGSPMRDVSRIGTSCAPVPDVKQTWCTAEAADRQTVFVLVRRIVTRVRVAIVTP